MTNITLLCLPLGAAPHLGAGQTAAIGRSGLYALVGPQGGNPNAVTRKVPSLPWVLYCPVCGKVWLCES